MARTVTFDVLAVAHGVGFDELGNKIKGVARDTQTHVSSLVAGLTAVGPALLPIAAATVAVGAGLTGLAAAGGVAFLALRQQWKAGTLQATDLGKQITTMIINFQGLKATTATAIAPGLTVGLRAVNSLTVPLGFALEKLATQFGKIAGNVAPALVLVFLKLMPLFTGLGDQLVKGSAAFLRWAQSGTGVTKFVEYAQANLPKVEKILGQLVVAIGHLSQGLLPLGGLSLSTVGVFAKAVNAIPVPVLKQIAPIIWGIVLATKAWEVAAKALNIVLAANPFVAVAGALVILSVAFVKLMQTNRAFRKFMEDSFISIASTAIGAMQSINHGFFSPFLTGLADVFRALGYLPGTLGHNFRAAANAVAGFRDDVTRQLNAAQQRLGSLRAHVDIVNAANDVARLKAYIDGVRSKSISITTYLQQVILPTLGTPGGSRDSRQPYTGLTAPYARAAGGPVMAGQSYIVGEQRPEVFTPSTSGYITPYVPSGGNTTVNVYVTNPDPRATIRAIEQWFGGGGKLHGGRGIVP